MGQTVWPGLGYMLHLWSDNDEAPTQRVWSEEEERIEFDTKKEE